MKNTSEKEWQRKIFREEDILSKKYPTYHTNTLSHHRRIEMVFKEKLPKIDNGLILDMGCSRGFTTHDLSVFYSTSKVIGIDINKEAIDYAISSGKKGIFLEGDGYRHNFQDDFDAIFCMNNLYYNLENRKYSWKESFNHLKNSIKEKGYLLISGVSGDYEEDFIILKKQNGILSLHDRSNYFKESRLKTILKLSRNQITIRSFISNLRRTSARA